MQIEIIDGLEQVEATAWNRLVQDNNPFMRHEFLLALEQNNCVGEAFGWLPRHIVIYENAQLIGAMPLYEKHNSYGEFVFDHAWASAYERKGLAYFPKLVSAIPYTPATGQRFLAASGHESNVFSHLLGVAIRLTQQLKCSSFHCLFPVLPEHSFMEQQGLITRHDCQFHWHNQGYQSFDDFLSKLSSKKRKNIRQERRKVEQSGLRLRVLDGYTATTVDWERFAFFYTRTFESKWGVPTLNQAFFMQVARHLPEQVVLVLADNAAGECIAGSLMFCSETRLYGRHWGCVEEWDCLHFEACYYQGIEYCIANGLHIFEPGAQGEHKVARGFVPTQTRSSHWVDSPVFRDAITRHAAHECDAVAGYMQEMWQHVPYREKPNQV